MLAPDSKEAFLVDSFARRVAGLLMNYRSGDLGNVLLGMNEVESQKLRCHLERFIGGQQAGRQTTAEFSPIEATEYSTQIAMQLVAHPGFKKSYREAVAESGELLNSNAGTVLNLKAEIDQALTRGFSTDNLSLNGSHSKITKEVYKLVAAKDYQEANRVIANSDLPQPNIDLLQSIVDGAQGPTHHFIYDQLTIPPIDRREIDTIYYSVTLNSELGKPIQMTVTKLPG